MMKLRFWHHDEAAAPVATLYNNVVHNGQAGVGIFVGGVMVAWGTSPTSAVATYELQLAAHAHAA